MAWMNGASSDGDTTEDALGFRITLTAKQQHERAESNKTAESTSQEWAAIAAKTQLPRESKLKKLIRKAGVPAQHRAWVWSQSSGANAIRESKPSSYFRNLVAASPTKSKSLKQIELDLPRTFPQHTWLQSPPGQSALRDVLAAFSVHCPDVGYCQSLNFVASLLLLNTGKQPEIAFWLLVALVERILWKDTYASSLAGCQVEMRTLGELVREKLPRLARHFEGIGCDVQLLSTDWYLCLFATSLPPEVTMRVWDVLMNEGAKVLFRIGLALLQVHEAELMRLDNAGEVLRALKEGSQALWDTNKLMDVAFRHVGGLPLARVVKIRTAQQAVVDRLTRERDAARRAADAKAAEASKQQRQEQQEEQQVAV